MKLWPEADAPPSLDHTPFSNHVGTICTRSVKLFNRPVWSGAGIAQINLKGISMRDLMGTSLCAQKMYLMSSLIEYVTLSGVRLHLLEKLENDNFSDIAKHLILSLMNSANRRDTVQFLLDCSTIPDVISATQSFGVGVLEELFRFTRAWCFAIHKKKLKLQGRWIKI